MRNWLTGAGAGAVLVVRRASVVLLLAVIVVGFGVSIPQTFLSSTTFQLVGSGQAVTVILSLAALIPLIGGEFDITIGAMAAFSTCLVTWFSLHTHWNIIVSCIVAIVICAAIGAISGTIVVYFRVSSFIATLAISEVLVAGALYISGNQQLAGKFSQSFSDAGNRNVLGVPLALLYVLVLGVVLWYIIELTPLGRRLRATGASSAAAKLAGVNTDRLVLCSFVASGALAAVAGILYAAQNNTFSNSFGQPLLFPAFAAVFLGATQFRGRLNVWGTVICAYTIALGVAGIQLAFFSSEYWISPMLNGVALIAAVTFARHESRARKGDSQEATDGGESHDASDVDPRVVHES